MPMPFQRIPNPLAWLCAGVMLAIGLLAAQSLHAETQQRRLGRDTFMSGEEVVVREALPGNALLAGARVWLESTVAGDAAVAGGELNLAGSASDDLYAAGGQVNVATAVGRSARLAGGEVHLQRGSKIGHGLTVVGGRITLDGEVGGYAVVTGGSIRVDGHIAGNLVAAGGELRLGPNAVIDGTLTYRGPQAAQLAPGATVHGAMRNIIYERPDWWRGWTAAAAVAGLLWLVGWAVLGMVLLAAMPNATRTVTRTAQARPALSLLIGIAVLAVTPAALAVLMATLIGIPLAIIAFLSYLLLLPLGYLAGVAAIGDWLALRGDRVAPLPTGRRVAMFVMVLVVVGLVVLIPLIGWTVGALVWLAGLGAIVLVAIGRGGPPDGVATVQA